MAKVKWTKEQYQALDSLHKNAQRLGQSPKVAKPLKDNTCEVPQSDPSRFTSKKEVKEGITRYFYD